MDTDRPQGRIDEDDDRADHRRRGNPEWTEEDFARAKSIFEIPELADLAEFVRKGGRPLLPERGQEAPRHRSCSTPTCIEHFKASGKGWQTRINAALRKAAGL